MAIVRAMLRKPGILLMDEATASLDAIAERGTPGELLAPRGMFAPLYELQVLKAKADTSPEISV